MSDDFQIQFSGEFLKKYRIVKLLGRGAMGAVYLAEELSLSRSVAIKFLTDLKGPDLLANERFREEARLCASMKHPNIVPLYTTGEEAGHPYLVFEYVEGRTLHGEIELERKLSPERTLEIMEGVLGGLDCAHSLGIVHRDLKPGNIILRRGDGQPLVLDFGMARAEDRDQYKTRKGLILGTPPYMAPELIEKGAVTPGIDLYSIGCTMFECLAGRPPFIADSDFKIVKMQMNDPPPPLQNLNPDVPVPLAKIVARALEKEPGRRFQHAREMTHWIRAARAQQPLPEPLAPTEPAKSSRIQRTTGKSRNKEETRPITSRMLSRIVMSVIIPGRSPFLPLGVILILLSVTVGGGLYYQRIRPVTQSAPVRIATTSKGSLQLSWKTSRGVRCALFYQKHGEAKDGAGNFHEEPEARESHDVTLEGLEPGTAYDLRITAQGQVIWTRTITFPAPVAAAISYLSATRARVEVAPPPGAAATLVLPRTPVPERLAMSDAGGGQLCFEATLDITAPEMEPVLELSYPPDHVHRQPVGHMSGLVNRFSTAITRLDMASVIQELVRHPGYDRNMDFAQYSMAGGGAPPGGRDGRHHGLGFFGGLKRKAPPGFFRDQLLSLIANHGIKEDLALFAGLSPPFFEDPKVPLPRKLDMYQALLRLQTLELVPLSQREEGHALGIAQLYAPLVRFSYLAPAPEQSRGVPLSGGTLGWISADFNQWGNLDSSTQRYPSFQKVLNGSQYPGKAHLRELFRSQRSFPVDSIPAALGSGDLCLRAVVLLFSPAYCLEVNLRPLKGQGLKVMVTHPGTLEWFRSMDGLNPRPRPRDLPVSPPPEQTVDLERDNSSYWGEVKIHLLRDLLPAPPFQIVVDYRHIPHVGIDDLCYIQRAMIMRELTLEPGT